MFTKNHKMRVLLVLFTTFFTLPLFSQDLDQQLNQLENQLNTLKKHEEEINASIEALKLKRIQRDLEANGLPKLEEGEKLIEHAAMSLVYAEKHEQAKWVAHIITPDIIKGSVFRTNDFRVDPKVSSGTAEEKDYFLKYLQPDSSYEYDGFGYDRGHLAPSADFRWSAKALSESYFYSNMSPQLPEFNREIWAELESKLRAYIYRNPGTQLYVVTGPVLKDDLQAVSKSVNRVHIPNQFWKVAVDLENKKAVGFLLPHEGSNAPLETFIVPIDEIEALTGLDFFHDLPDNLENLLERQVEKATWIPELQGADVEPIGAPSLPKNHFNTTQAQRYMGMNDEVNICGTAVSTRLSRKGNALINLDKQFPNQVFTVFIRKEHLINFSYDPVEVLKDKAICVKGKVISLGGTPAIFIENEKQLDFYTP